MRKLKRFATYSFLLVLTAFISALLGGKKITHEVGGSFLVPSAHADVPIGGDVPGDGRGDTDAGVGVGNAPDPFGGVNGTDQPGSLDMKDANDLAQA